MTRLTKEEVLHIAKLAKLNLSDEKIAKFTEQLSKVVDFVSQLSEVDVKGIEPTSQTTGLENVYREDKKSAKESLNEDGALSGTDKAYNGYFKVDAILTERTDK